MMKRLSLTLLAFAFAFAPLAVRADDKLVDRPLGKYFLFAGMNTRIDSIEVSKTKVDNPALKDMGENNDNPGFVVIRMSMQNPSSSEDRSVPGNEWGWELADGTQRDMSDADQTYSGKSLVSVPDSLHPKQTITLTYVFAWNGSPITKLFLKQNSGNETNSTGAHYVRFAITPDDLKPLGS